ncbi:MAG TPA: high-affinity branched-chain amino acid ABC transporter permease LivM [Geminicoccaceae bacterium]|nr:high-affinity branched-chain amino acid ABC transporter permease LivM [Geminicoccaceae bacterium]
MAATTTPAPAPAVAAPRSAAEEAPGAVWREALTAGGVTFLLTVCIVGFETVSGVARLTLRPRPGAVAFAVIAATLGAASLAYLRRGNARVPLILAAVAAAVMLLPLLTGGPDSPFGWLLPFEAMPLNWGALLVPLVVALRAAAIVRERHGTGAGAIAATQRLGGEVQRLMPVIAGGLLLFALLLPFLPFADRRLIDICTLTVTYVMLGWGLNIVVGLAGLLDLGYVAFYAVGAYTYALLSVTYGMGFWECLPIAAGLAALTGILLGFPVLRLRGDYLAIVTLGFGEMIRIVLINWWWFTGGPNGINNVARPSFFGLPFERTPPPGGESFASFFGLAFDPYHRIVFLYFLILAFALATNLFTLRIRRMPLGRAWEALREDETACRALGINPTNTKLTAFSIGAMFAGIAGSFFAARQGFVSPESFVFIESAVILAIVVLGGLGSQTGIVLAAIVLIGLPEFFRELKDYRMLAFGLGMVLIMVWRPRGLLAHREPTIRLHPRRSGAAG